MNFAKFSVRRPIATLMATLVVMVFGAMSITNINLDMMPNMDIPIAIVSTQFPGVGSAEVESLITIPLEGVLGTVPGIAEISSNSGHGVSTIILEFEDGVDINFAALNMRERIDMIAPMLPDGASTPMVMQIDINAQNAFLFGITPHNGDLITLHNVVGSQMVNRLERIDGVAQVSMFGGIETEIEVLLHEEQLRGFGISEQTVVQILRAENASFPTGSIREGDRTMSLRVSGEFETLMDIENIPFMTPTGGLIYLRDFADVNMVFRDPSAIAYVNGTPAVMLEIQAQSTANTVNVSNLILREISRLQEDFPSYDFSILIDPAEFINLSINSVVSAAMWGGLFAVLVLYFFLKNVKSTIIIAVAMPVSIVATFVMMYAMGLTLNMMSLGGLALGVGMLIDNSIVVLESIFRKIEDGETKIKASIEGAQEVAAAVTASTITTVAVFLPIAFAGGLAAQIFNELALTIAFSLLASLFVSLTFVPMACSVILSVDEILGKSERRNIISKALGKMLSISDKLLAINNKVYSKMLKFCLRRRLTTYFIVFLFVVLTGLSLTAVRMEFMAESDMSLVQIDVRLPRGTLINETEAIILEVSSRLDHFEEVESLTAIIQQSGPFGGGGADRGDIWAVLSSVRYRDRSASEIALAMQRELQDIPGARITVSALQMMGMGGGGGGISFRIFGDDIEVLRDIAVDVIALLEEVPGTHNVTSSVETASPQATIRVDRQRASAFGISPAAVSNVVSTAVTGTVATTYRVDGQEFDVRVRQNHENFEFITDIQNILIPTATGITVPLYEIADVVISDIPLTIQRQNMQTFISINTQFADGDVNPSELSNLITAAMSEYILPSGYTWAFTGAMQQMDETFTSLLFALLMAILLVYMIMAFQFESFSFPFIVMFSIPIALTGGILGLFILDNTFDITAFLGLIMLAGVVTNNAIVIIDYINLLIRERGMEVYDAVVRAGTRRLRPILITAITTILALTPMLVSNADGAEMMRSLATVVVFGLAFSTLVTTLLIPTVYMSIENRKNKRKLRKEQKAAKKLAATASALLQTNQ